MIFFLSLRSYIFMEGHSCFRPFSLFRKSAIKKKSRELYPNVGKFFSKILLLVKPPNVKKCFFESPGLFAFFLNAVFYLFILPLVHIFFEPKKDFYMTKFKSVNTCCTSPWGKVFFFISGNKPGK